MVKKTMTSEPKKDSEIKKRNRFKPDTKLEEYAIHIHGMSLNEHKKVIKYLDALYKKRYKDTEHKKLAERLSKM